MVMSMHMPGPHAGAILERRAHWFVVPFGQVFNKYDQRCLDLPAIQTYLGDHDQQSLLQGQRSRLPRCMAAQTDTKLKQDLSRTQQIFQAIEERQASEKQGK